MAPELKLCTVLPDVKLGTAAEVSCRRTRSLCLNATLPSVVEAVRVRHSRSCPKCILIASILLSSFVGSGDHGPAIW